MTLYSSALHHITSVGSWYTCLQPFHHDYTTKGHLLNEPNDIARRIVDLLTDRQAENIVLLDIRKVASFADYFVIATATNRRQMQALIEIVDNELRTDDIKPHHKEGNADSGWVLVDYGAIILHIFSADHRAYYALEELWSGATEVVRIQ